MKAANKTVDHVSRFKDYVLCPDCGIEYAPNLGDKSKPRMHSCGVISERDELLAIKAERDRKRKLNRRE